MIDYASWWKEKEKPKEPFVYPDWWLWTGGWYELDGDNTYALNWNLNENSVVVEVGSYRGVWLSRMLPRYHCNYWCIEPSAYSFKALKEVVGQNAKAHLCNFALWVEDGKGTLSDVQRDGANLFGKLEPTQSVELIDAKRFFDENKIDKVDLLSMNIEGAEFQLLPYFVKTGLIMRLQNLMLQWHADVSVPNGERPVWEIREKIAKTHKMVWNLSAWECWTKKG